MLVAEQSTRDSGRHTCATHCHDVACAGPSDDVTRVYGSDLVFLIVLSLSRVRIQRTLASAVYSPCVRRQENDYYY